MSEKQFIWREKNIKSFGQLCDIIEEIIKKPDGQAREEATLFMRAYHDFSENARENIGYLSGYYGTEDAKRIRSVFKVVHPIFGNAKPTPEEAFAAGMKWGPEGISENKEQPPFDALSVEQEIRIILKDD